MPKTDTAKRPPKTKARTAKKKGREQLTSSPTHSRLPGRVVTFLEAVGTRRDVRALVASGGYGPEDHAEGLSLLAAACAYGAALPSGGDRDAEARSALRDLERWTSANLDRYRIAVERLHPDEVSPFVGLEAPAQGDALRVVAALLERLKQLEAREASVTVSATAAASAAGARTGEPSLLATLARRGFDVGERKRLEHWVTTAQAAPAPTKVPERECRDTELLALHRWYTDWVATAKSLTRQRRILIALGLASRGKRDDGGEE